MGTSSPWCARASRSLDSCRRSGARACRISNARRLTATYSSSITACSRPTPQHRHGNVRLAHPPHRSMLTPSSQISLKHFMGKHLEIKTNYRLICWLLYTFLLHLGANRYILYSANNQPVVVEKTSSADRHRPLIDLALRTTVLVLHIDHIPPHNDNYNNNTSTGRTRRTGKKKK